ncbi:MAG: phosphoadenosine phosphosulfate reductase family protein [Saprospiraceae bacterium]|nr:phosphoadenosine phosphosulfate reductase family protein [Saprospiraceae bacterium]
MISTIAISFSGGRTSAYMSHLLLTNEKYKAFQKVFIFANTGKEREETLNFVHQCDKHFGMDLTWVEADVNPEKGIGTSYRIVDYETASRKGEPFAAMVEKYGIPNKDFPHCTRELKQRPISKFLDDAIGKNQYCTAIGLRIDERIRLNRLSAEKNNYIYPLIDDFPTFEAQVRNFWDAMPFDLRLKDYEGNCDLCWKKSRRKRLTLIAENPGIEKQWVEWEDNDEYVFDRDGLSIYQLVEMSSRPFRRAVDQHELRKQAPSLFNAEMDVEQHCVCFI